MRHLISIQDLTDKDLIQLTDKAAGMKLPKATSVDPKKPAVSLIFAEPSTRTRVSFERAAQLGGRHTTLLQATGSSLEKEESLEDTLCNLARYGFGVHVIRQSKTGALEALRALGCGSIVNAGDGTGEHPTQILGDITALKRWGKKTGRKSVEGLKLAIAGDIRRSRVAASWAKAASRLGVQLMFFCPHEWRPLGWGEKIAWSDKKEDLNSVDGVMALRIQKERMQPGEEWIMDDFVGKFQITPQDLLEQQFLMHPGPVNWGVELAPVLRSDPRSLILEQAESALFVRYLLLDWLDA